ncbi:conserved hypothetical protein [Ricinus communis]|uniref:Uncharacterized protein n=1 Tax=Ricinus communis TaxID=3988 RepID=B9RQM4_RICCO|nr:conserved hypothetical protein [Ricinus communis]
MLGDDDANGFSEPKPLFVKGGSWEAGPNTGEIPGGGAGLSNDVTLLSLGE